MAALVKVSVFTGLAYAHLPSTVFRVTHMSLHVKNTQQWKAVPLAKKPNPAGFKVMVRWSN